MACFLVDVKGLKERYDMWVSQGKPNLSAVELDRMFETSCDDLETALNNSASCSVNESTTYNGKPGKFMKCFIPDEERHNLVEVPYLPQHSFKNKLLKKIDDLHAKKASTPAKVANRINVNPFSSIVTCDEQFEKAIDNFQKKKVLKVKKRTKGRIRK